VDASPWDQADASCSVEEVWVARGVAMKFVMGRAGCTCDDVEYDIALGYGVTRCRKCGAQLVMVKGEATWVFDPDREGDDG
jgi:hypothetical protein